jgi:hypothetical protein
MKKIAACSSAMLLAFAVSALGACSHSAKKVTNKPDSVEKKGGGAGTGAGPGGASGGGSYGGDTNSGTPPPDGSDDTTKANPCGGY